MTKKYEQVIEGKWYETPRNSTFICCDCCLVHKIQFKLEKGKLYSKWKRDDRSTAGYRRAKEARKIIKKLI